MIIVNLLDKKVISKVVLSGMVLYSGVCFCNNIKVDEPIKISKGTFDSLKKIDKSFSSFSYCTIDGKSLSFNKNVVKDNLNRVKSLDFDASCSDVNDLEYMSNLDSLNISNFMCLDDSDVEFLNNLDLNSFKIILNSSDFSKIKNFDFSKFDNSVFYFDFSNASLLDNDMMDLYYYNVVNYLNDSYDDLKFNLLNFDEEKLSKCKRLDYKVNEIIDSFNFDEKTTNYEKILQILFYVNGNLEYDKDVSSFLAKNVPVTDEMHNLYLKYSGNMIGNFLDEDNHNSICCNYTGLVSTLAYYSNVDLSYNYGTKGDALNNGHSWCIYSEDDKDYIVDPTSLDSNVYFDMYRCMTGMKIDDLNIDEYFNSYKARDIVLNPNFERYKTSESIDFMDNNEFDVEKNIEYINEDGKYYYKYALKKANYSFILGGMSLLGLILDCKLSKKKKYKVKKYRYKKMSF